MSQHADEPTKLRRDDRSLQHKINIRCSVVCSTLSNKRWSWWWLD